MSEGDSTDDANERDGGAQQSDDKPKGNDKPPGGPDDKDADIVKQVARVAQSLDLEAIAPDGAAPDAVFQLLWKRVIEAWDDDKPHQLALSYAIEHEMLPEIAGRYRKLMDDPAKKARAEKKINGIVVAATQMLLATKTPPREKVPWQWTASAALFMVVVVAFLAYKILGRNH